MEAARGADWRRSNRVEDFYTERPELLSQRGQRGQRGQKAFKHQHGAAEREVEPEDVEELCRLCTK